MTRQSWAILGEIFENTAKSLKNGGWYRDRTCDPYHVKACVIG
jgi:hypothetical protein